MSQRNLAGMRPVAAADQPGVADGVVRRTEWAVADERCAGRELIGHRVDAGNFKSFIDGHLWQDTGQGAGEQGFPGTGWPLHEHIVSSCCCNFECALDVFLAFDFCKVCGGEKGRGAFARGLVRFD